MRACFTTLGCKVNQYETQVLKQLFAAEGFDIVDGGGTADVCVINSCTVTDVGDKKTRQALRRAARENPGAVIALTGCFPQAFPDAPERIPEAHVITGTNNRRGLIEAVKRCMATGERIVNITPYKKGESFEHMSADSFLERSRAFVKIEDGCENYCSYCIIPKARGPIRSKPLNELREELTALAAQGYKEIVLVGINLSCYGREFGLRLIDAIRAASEIEGVERIRLGSLEPEIISHEDIVELALLEKFCPQFHLALQSGCDATLKRMNRHYDTSAYMNIVNDIRSAFQNPSITTDIMVGFPQETDEEFEQSLEFFNKIGFARAHVFSYSVREGTVAARLSPQVPKHDKDIRSERLIAAANEAQQKFLQSQVGRSCEVLFEARHGEYFEGYTKNYTAVRLKSEENLHGTIIKVRLTGTGDGFCTAEQI